MITTYPRMNNVSVQSCFQTQAASFNPLTLRIVSGFIADLPRMDALFITFLGLLWGKSPYLPIFLPTPSHPRIGLPAPDDFLFRLLVLRRRLCHVRCLPLCLAGPLLNNAGVYMSHVTATSTFTVTVTIIAIITVTTNFTATVTDIFTATSTATMPQTVPPPLGGVTWPPAADLSLRRVDVHAGSRGLPGAALCRLHH